MQKIRPGCRIWLGAAVLLACHNAGDGDGVEAADGHGCSSHFSESDQYAVSKLYTMLQRSIH